MAGGLHTVGVPHQGDTVAINDYSFPEIGGKFQRGAFRERLGAVRKKTGTRGKSRFSIDIESEPLLHQFDHIRLGDGPANAIAEYMQHQIRSTQAQVRDTTYQARQRAMLAYERGRKWATRQYSGGRLKETPPRDTRQALNFSGRLAQGIAARENKYDGGWTVNVPANRMHPRDFRSQNAFEHFLDQVAERVPEIHDPARFGEVEEVRQAIVNARNEIIVTTRDRGRGLQKQLRQEQLKALRNARGIVTAGL